MLWLQDLELFSNIIHELGSEGEKKKTMEYSAWATRVETFVQNYI